MNRDTAAPPLDGLVVADFSRVLAGPLTSMMLGDLGADVVKVEQPGAGDDTRSWGPPYASDGESAYYLSINRNKVSVEIDLGTSAGRARARRLALEADVLIENFRSGTAGRFGLGYAELAADNPRLIYARVSGFGSGPGTDLPGYDFLVQAMSGLMSITGDPDGPPTKTGVAIVDVLTGLNVTVGVLAALAERSRSGKGQFLDVSLMSSALAGLVNQASSFLTTGVAPERMGNLHPSIAPYEPFITATEPIVVAVGNDAQFRSLCEVMSLPEAPEDPRWRTNADRVQHRAALHEELEARFGGRGRDDWIERLRSVGVPCGPINTIAEAFEAAEDMGLNPIVSLERSTGGEVATTANPIRFSRTPVVYRRPPPLLGED